MSGLNSHTRQLARREPAIRPSAVRADSPAKVGHRRAKKVIRLVVIAVVLLAGFTSTLFSAYTADQLANSKQVTTLAIRGDVLNAKTAQQVLDTSAQSKDAPSFTLWEERSAEHVQNAALGRSAKASVILAYGNVNLVVTGVFLPERNLPQSVSSASSTASEATFSSPVVATSYTKQDCVIDTTTALELFGDSNVVGLSIRYGNEDFIVSSVVDAARPLVIIRPTGQTGVAFDMITAYNVSGQSSTSFGQQLAVSLGLETEVLDYELLYSLAYLLTWLPILILCGGYLAFLLVQGFSKDNPTRHQNFFLLGFLFSCIALVFFIAFNVQLPRDMIPSRFSDFALWQQIWDDKTAALLYLFDSPVYAPAAPLHDNFLVVVVLSVVSLALYSGAVALLMRTSTTDFYPRPAQKQREALPNTPVIPQLPTAYPLHSHTHDLPLSRYNWGKESQRRHP